MQEILLPEELEWLKSEGRLPFVTATMLTCIVDGAGMKKEQQACMDAEINRAVQMFGATDAIFKQPLPSSYTRCPAVVTPCTACECSSGHSSEKQSL